jgi:hypothetical protein
MGRSAADIRPITQGGDVSYWFRLSKREPSPDDDEDEPEADSSTRDIARMEPVFPAVSAKNTVGDPNGISSVGNLILKVLTLLPQPPQMLLTA